MKQHDAYVEVGGVSEILCSIVVPVHNRKKLLRRCIDSLLHLHLPSYEVILVDDGSMDGAADVCDVYADAYREVKVIHQENQGVIIARAIGWKASTGKYIAFVDSDDWLEPETYTWMLQQMETRSSIDIGIPRLVREYEDGHFEDMFPEHERCILNREECIQEIFFELKSFGWEVGKIYRRVLLEHWVPDPLAYTREDLDMFWQLLRPAQKILYDGAAVYHYLMHAQNSQLVDILQQDGDRSYLKILRDIEHDGNLRLQQEVAMRSMCITRDRINERYLQDVVGDGAALRNDICRLRELYQRMPDKTQAIRIARLAAEGDAAVEGAYQSFLKGIEEAILAAGAYQHVYVYGTGQVSKWLDQIFTRVHMAFDAYVVSDDQTKAEGCRGHDVRFLSEIPVDPQNNAFILALAGRNRGEVMELLRKRGHQNIFCFPTYPIFAS